jgi:hypothetical protein
MGLLAAGGRKWWLRKDKEDNVDGRLDSRGIDEWAFLCLVQKRSFSGALLQGGVRTSLYRP